VRAISRVLMPVCSPLTSAARDRTGFGLLMLDLDHFKSVNDVYGHLAGDVVLKAVATAITGEVREYDAVGRFGGEEFVVLLPGCAMSDAHALVDRLRAATPSGQTCSAGVAAWDGSEAISALLERADARLAIPMREGVSSLNLATTVSAVLFSQRL